MADRTTPRGHTNIRTMAMMESALVTAMGVRAAGMAAAEVIDAASR
jgi:hypothetical protein